MRAKSTAAKAAARAEVENRKAISEAKLAYEFVPNSYTHSCLSACLAVEFGFGCSVRCTFGGRA